MKITAVKVSSSISPEETCSVVRFDDGLTLFKGLEKDCIGFIEAYDETSEAYVDLRVKDAEGNFVDYHAKELAEAPYAIQALFSMTAEGTPDKLKFWGAELGLPVHSVETLETNVYKICLTQNFPFERVVNTLRKNYGNIYLPIINSPLQSKSDPTFNLQGLGYLQVRKEDSRQVCIFLHRTRFPKNEFRLIPF